jgi:hypothetical protein
MADRNSIDFDEQATLLQMLCSLESEGGQACTVLEEKEEAQQPIQEVKDMEVLYRDSPGDRRIDSHPSVVVEHPMIPRVCCALEAGFKVCVVIRGLPGRGKTTLALAMAKEAERRGFTAVCSASDDFMVRAMEHMCGRKLQLQNSPCSYTRSHTYAGE